MATQKQAQLTPLGSAFAGAMGAVLANATLYPLDIAKTRLQGPGRKESLPQIMRDIHKNEGGVKGFYKGLAATLLGTFSMQYTYFFFYSLIRSTYIRRLSARLPKGSRVPAPTTVAELLLGALAGALASICTLPVSTIATRQQQAGMEKRKLEERKADLARKLLEAMEEGSAKQTASENGDATPSESRSAERASVSPYESALAQEMAAMQDIEYDDSFQGVISEIVSEEGPTGLWLGIKPALILTVNPAITYGVYERVKGILLLAQEKASGSSSKKLSPWTAFLLGAVSKSLATVVTYPYIMAKTRIQMRSADVEEAIEEHKRIPRPLEFHHAKMRHAGPLDVLGRAWRDDGIWGLYQGMGAQLLKATLTQCLLFLLKEQIEHWALSIIVMLHSVRQRRLQRP